MAKYIFIRKPNHAFFNTEITLIALSWSESLEDSSLEWDWPFSIGVPLTKLLLTSLDDFFELPLLVSSFFFFLETGGSHSNSPLTSFLLLIFPSLVFSFLHFCGSWDRRDRIYDCLAKCVPASQLMILCSFIKLSELQFITYNCVILFYEIRHLWLHIYLKLDWWYWYA